jgi:membrane-associated phospholipid phosphatase
MGTGCRRTAWVVPTRTRSTEVSRDGSSTVFSALPRQDSRQPSLGVRLRSLWKIKFIATPVLMTAFFVAYFFVLNSPLFPVTIMRLTPIDDWVGFVPWTLPLYLSLWIYVMLVHTFIAERRELMIYGQTVIALAVVGLGIFLIYPTAVPPAQIEWNRYPSFQFLKTVDATGNACPSLHVAFALFSAMWLHRLLKSMRTPGAVRLLNWIWCVGIVYSTVATKQHVTIDVLAGAALGAGAAVIGLKRVSSPARR